MRCWPNLPSPASNFFTARYYCSGSARTTLKLPVRFVLTGKNGKARRMWRFCAWCCAVIRRRRRLSLPTVQPATPANGPGQAWAAVGMPIYAYCILLARWVWNECSGQGVYEAESVSLTFTMQVLQCKHHLRSVESVRPTRISNSNHQTDRKTHALQIDRHLLLSPCTPAMVVMRPTRCRGLQLAHR